MNVTTLSLMAGSIRCNATCPFCVSRMTGPSRHGTPVPMNRVMLSKAVRLAKAGGCISAMITGKGEPMLHPTHIYQYVKHVGSQIPLLCLQTNGIILGHIADGDTVNDVDSDVLRKWHRVGLDTIAISVVDVHDEVNKDIYLSHTAEDYPSLACTVTFLKKLGFCVRLCVTMQHPYVSTPADVSRVVTWCKAYGVDQLSMRPVRVPKAMVGGEKQHIYASDHSLLYNEIAAIFDHVDANGTRLRIIGSGAHAFHVFDYKGQNLALPNCLTVSPLDGEIRNIIFSPDGRIRHDWQYEGAILA